MVSVKHSRFTTVQLKLKNYYQLKKYFSYKSCSQNNIIIGLFLMILIQPAS